jgi:hypothetical protein
MASVKEKRTLVTVICEECGVGKETIYPERTRFCSVRCSNVWHKRNIRGESKGAYYSSRQVAIYVPPIKNTTAPTTVVLGTNTPWYCGMCRRCNKSFVTKQSMKVYCSRYCAKKDARSRRRARQVNAYIEHVWFYRVMERDNWTCHLCDQPIDRTAQVPQLYAATLDHVIPLALGGEHSMNNIRSAHFICNSIKGDRV